MSERLAASTVRTNFGVLRTILNAAVEADILLASPCKGIKLSAEPPRLRFLTIEQLDRLASSVHERYGPLVYVGGILGLRWSEAVGLKRSRVNFLRRTVEVSEALAEVDGRLYFSDVKTRNSRRTLQVPLTLVERLAQHVEAYVGHDDDALMFTTPSGAPLRRSNFNQREWGPAVAAAGLHDFRFHDLRHAAVGFMIAGGAHIETIKARCGHSSIRVTSDIYGSVLPTVDDGVTNALELMLRGASGASVVSAGASASA